MFIKNGNNYICNSDFERLIEPHVRMIDEYLETYIIPEVVAYYLATGLFTTSLYEEPLMVHITSILQTFNHKVSDMKQLKYNVRQLLTKKYGLIIINEKPLQFKFRII
jgi:hypothetical protein